MAIEPNPIITISDQGRLAWYGWRSPFPSSVKAAESLWILWRKKFLEECSNKGK